ncbi:MAG: TRAM domain-containing protein [Candidatus Rhabdochlamydia sp.]
MNLSLSVLRQLFLCLIVMFTTLLMISLPEGQTLQNGCLGIVLGVLFFLCLLILDRCLKTINLRSINISILGCFVGYLMGKVFFLIFEAALEMSSIEARITPSILELIKIFVFLATTYLGAVVTLRASDELYITIPFVHFTQETQKKKDLIVDFSALSDLRIIDLALTGLINHTLIIPRFVLKDLYFRSELMKDISSLKAKKTLEVIRRLESIPHLELRYHETDFSEIKDPLEKIIRLAHLINANVLTSDANCIPTAAFEGIQVINLQSLSNALQPLMQGGEVISIKIQRLGKEVGQGVGYLEDGSMVVINGSSEMIGKIVEGKVLSVKHTSSGRIVFCNLVGDENAFKESLL